MTTIDIESTERVWSAPVDDAWTRPIANTTSDRFLELPQRTDRFAERVERLLPVLTGVGLVAVDLALVFGAFMAAHWVRFNAADESLAALGLDQYMLMAAGIAVITTVLFAFRGLYDEPRPYAWPTRLYTIVSAVSTALVVGLTVSYFLGDGAFSRLWSATGWAIAIGALIAWRELATHAYTAIRERVAPARRALVVGANPLGKQLASELAEWCHVVGYVDNGTDLVDPSLRLLGPVAELEHIVHDYAIDELIIALPTKRREQVTRLVDRGFRRAVKIKFVTGIGELLPERLEVQRLGGRSYIAFEPVAKVGWIKRAMDVVLVGGGLIAISPVLALIALAIKLDSHGPVFYRQTRVGKNGRHFSMLKFRSMCVDADKKLDDLKHQNEATGPLFKIKADPRITRIGRIMRRYSLDELPQLFNVVRGEMSLVGPRPPLPAEVAEYEDWQLGRLRATPGLTGLWQVSGRSEVPFHDMVRLDLHYIRNWSLSLDLEILLRTVPAVVSSRGAY
jgi:exopolysaccharide biosynthesis polyprenyl glycosylphosphotransferase